MKTVLKISVIMIIIAGLGYGGCKLFEKKESQETEIIKAEKTEKTGDSQGESKKEAALPVKVITIKRGNFPLRLNISATADVRERADVRTEIPGTIEGINVKVGDWVREGQVLVQLNKEERQLDVEQRKAEKLRSFSQFLVNEDTSLLGNTELTEEQKKELALKKQKYLEAVQDFEKGKINRDQFDAIQDDYQKLLMMSGEMREEIRRAQEGLSAAIVQLKQSQLNLKRCTIRSPFQGYIADLLVSKGETVSSAQTLLRVVNLKTLFLRGFALESELQNLKEGTNVRIRFDSFPEQFFYGEIESISPEIDETRKTITVYVKVDNKDNLFLPGMHAEIDVEYKIFENVIKVPRDAVLTRQDRYLVFTIKDIQGRTGTANWVYVEVGHQNDEEIEILSGVEEGDLVVVYGHMTLAHQSKVTITN